MTIISRIMCVLSLSIASGCVATPNDQQQQLWAFLGRVPGENLVEAKLQTCKAYQEELAALERTIAFELRRLEQLEQDAPEYRDLEFFVEA